MLRKLLLPIDLSEPEFAPRAIEEAQVLAKPLDCEVRLVNVQSLIPIRFIDYVRADFETHIRVALEAEMAALAAKIDRPRDRVSSAVLFGPVHDSILDEAKMGNRIDHHRLASAGHGSLPHRLRRQRHRQTGEMLVLVLRG